MSGGFPDSDFRPLPVAGYSSQSPDKVALVNEFKADEERLLRKIIALINSLPEPYSLKADMQQNEDARESVHYFKVGFMLLNRAVFQPQRIKLPEDDE